MAEFGGDDANSDRISTDLDSFDNQLDGGFQPGTVVALLGDPASRSQSILYNLLAEPPLYYISATKSERQVYNRVQQVAPIGKRDFNYLDLAGKGIDTVRQKLVELAEQSSPTLVIDPTNVLEDEDETEYVKFLRQIKTTTEKNRGLTILHGIEEQTARQNRWATVHQADMVLETFVEDTNDKLKIARADPRLGDIAHTKFKISGGSKLEVSITERLK